MKAKAIRSTFTGSPAAIASFGAPAAETDTSIGTDYEIHALSVFKGVVFLQIVNDLDIITWLPAWFFDVSGNSVPSDWVCLLPPGELQLVLGPAFLARDEASYDRMVQLKPDSVRVFWRRQVERR
jgi:hypothetical protein